MEESTQFSKRYFSAEQTTKIVHLCGTKSKVQSPAPTSKTQENVTTFSEPEPGPVSLPPPLEPFPFTPDPVQPKRKSQTPVQLLPKKFVPAETKESDYESDYDGTKIRPKWTPAGGGDAEEPVYRVVRPPAWKKQPFC